MIIHSVLRCVTVTVCLMAFLSIAHQNEFVVKKEKRRKQPKIGKLREQYACEAGEVVKIIPELQKSAAELHKLLINDVNEMLTDISSSRVSELSKDELIECNNIICGIAEGLRKFDKKLKKVSTKLVRVS